MFGVRGDERETRPMRRGSSALGRAPLGERRELGSGMEGQGQTRHAEGARPQRCPLKKNGSVSAQCEPWSMFIMPRGVDEKRLRETCLWLQLLCDVGAVARVATGRTRIEAVSICHSQGSSSASSGELTSAGHVKSQCCCSLCSYP